MYVLYRPATCLHVERVLLIAEEYIKSVEESFTGERTFTPHGASYYGCPLNVICNLENREDFVVQVSFQLFRRD